MHIKNIELRDFRNYGALNLELHEKVNIFLGNNAQGKTNLIESIYMSSLGKSFRTSKDSEMIKFGAEFCRIKVEAVKDNDPLNVEIVITGKGKGIKVDGVKIKKTSELLENIYTVVFSPEDLKIVKEEPEKRRKFIDTELCQLYPSYYLNLANYKKTLKQRNTLLKDIKFGQVSPEIEATLLVWDEKLTEYGSKIMIQRNSFVEKLKLISRKLHEDITNGKESLEISYEPKVRFSDSLRDQQDIFRKTLQENIKNDIRNGITSCGPHKDDLKLCINNVDIRHFGSQGQQRTAALSLKLAEIRLIKEETGEDAVLLLDDVMSELDGSRQNYLINSLGDVQLFITTTELSDEVKSALPAGQTFYVSAGNVKAY